MEIRSLISDTQRSFVANRTLFHMSEP